MVVLPGLDVRLLLLRLLRPGIRLEGSVLGYSGHFVDSGHIDYSNLYQIYRRNGPVSRTFEMRIEQCTNVPGFCSKVL